MQKREFRKQKAEIVYREKRERILPLMKP